MLMPQYSHYLVVHSETCLLASNHQYMHLCPPFPPSEFAVYPPPYSLQKMETIAGGHSATDLSIGSGYQVQKKRKKEKKACCAW